MKKLLSRSFHVFLMSSVIISMLSSSIGPVQAEPSGNTITNVTATKHHKQIIVKYKNNEKAVASKKEIKTKLKLGKLDTKAKMRRSNVEVLEIGDNDDVNQTIAELKKDPNVQFAQPDYKLTISSSALADRFDELWGLSNTGQNIGYQAGESGMDIKAKDAWKVTQGASSTVVGVLDTGVDISHPDLKSHMYINSNEIPDNGIDDDGNGYVDDVNGWDFSNHDATVYDSAADDKHGTHVAGIIAETAPKVTILPLKFISGTTGYTSDAIEAIEYAKQMGVKVMNASFGSPEVNPALQEAMSQSDMLFVCAAGNNGQDMTKAPIYPAAYKLPNVISVAAIDNQGKLASNSNYGSSVDVAAPGVGILSTLPNREYGYLSGTSMAAAMSTGTAALVRSQFSDLTAEQLAQRVQSSTTYLKSLEGKTASSGVINAAKALKATETKPDTNKPNTTQKPSTGKGDMVVTLATTIDTSLQEQIHYGEEGVSVTTGNYSKSITDLTVTAPGFSVDFTRTYNSKDDRASSTMGRGWTFGFEGNLKDDSTNSTLKVAKLPKGTAMVFVKNTDGTYTANDSHGTLVKQTDGTHLLTTADQYKYVFNTAGYLTSMQDRNGNIVKIDVDSTGKVVKITDTVGRVYTVTYNAAGYLTMITDPMNRNVKYSYDGSNRLVTVTDPEGNVISSYVYDTYGYLTKLKDASQNIVETIVYDHSPATGPHKVSQYTDNMGSLQNYTYDLANRMTTIKDINGRVVVKWYDTAMFVIKSQDPEGRLTFVEYYNDANGFNKFGEEKAVTDRNGNKTQYTRDSNGNITKSVNPDGSSNEYSYDDKNNLISEKDELGKLTFYIYDANKLLLLKKVRPLNGTDSYNANDPSKFATSSYAYYSLAEVQKLGLNVSGLLKSETDPEGNTTSYTYDRYGNKATLTDPEGNSTSASYNILGWKTSQISPRGYRTDYNYDNNGHVIRSAQSEGETNRFIYDSQQRLVQSIAPMQYVADKDGLNDNTLSNSYRDAGAGTRYVYYPNGKIQKQTDVVGNETIFTYDIYGNKLTETRPNKSSYVYQYDVMNRVSKMFFKTSAQAVPDLLAEYSYKVLDNGKTQKKEMKYLNGTDTAVTTWTYDDQGQEVERQNPDGNSVSNVYETNGVLKATTDARGNTSYFNYDGLNRLTDSWIPLDAGKYTYKGVTYDRDDRKLVESVGKDPVTLYAKPLEDRKIVTKYQYDGNDKVLQTTTSSGSKSLFKYDEEGNLIKKEIYTSANTSISTEYAYNDQGKKTSEKHVVDTKDLYSVTTGRGDKAVLETTTEYDLNGNAVAETTPDGVRSEVTYDALNRPIATKKPSIDEQGNPVVVRTSLTYDWQGKVLVSTDAKGNKTQLEYNEKGLAVKKTDALAGVSLTVYDKADRKIAEISPQSYDASKSWKDLSRTEFTYDTMSRIKVITEKFNEQKLSASWIWSPEWTEKVSKGYLYDENGNVTKELDGEGYATGVGSNIDAKLQTGYGTITRYNAANLVSSTLDPIAKDRGLKNSSSYAYDGAGRKIVETDANNVLELTSYDDAGKVLSVAVKKSVTSPEQTMELHTYDLAGQPLSQTDGNGNVTSYSYNNFGLIRSVTSPGDETISDYTITKQYDRLGNLAKEGDSLGKVNLYEYDKESHLISSTEQAEDGSQPITTKTAYDVIGNKRYETDGNGNIHENVYDSLNRLIEERNSVTNLNAGVKVHVTQYTYDANGNKLTETNWLGNTGTLIYDDKNRLVERKDASGVTTQRLEYNLNDTQVRSWDALNRLNSFAYNKNNVLVSSVNAEGNTSSTDYDVLGQKQSVTDENGNTTRYSYDYLGHLSTVTNALDEVTSYTYDLNGNKLTQTDGKGNKSTFEYNVSDLLIRRMDPAAVSTSKGNSTYQDSRMETYTYYANGMMKTKKDRNGNITSYVLDIHKRQVSRVVDGPTLASTPLQDRKVSYSYDNNNNQLTVTDKNGITSRTYDEMNRTVTKSLPKLGTNTYQYDEITGLPQGNRAEITTDVKGNVTRKVYDKTNRLSEVKANNDASYTYSYYADGTRQTATYPNGIREEYTYTPANRLSTLKNFKGNQVMDSYQYAYDAAGNQLSKDELINNVPKGKTTYAYDVLNRLQSVLEPGGRQTTYAFDAAGNRTEQRVKDAAQVKTTQYEYNDQNRLNLTREITSEGSAQAVNYHYDNNGNLMSKTSETIKKIDPLKPTDPSFGMFIYGQKNENPRIENIVSGTASYEYDVWDQLTKSSSAGGTVTYEYNGEGLRTKKTSNGTVNQYVYEYDKVVLETDGSGKQTAFNLYGTNLLTRKVGTDKYSYLYNGHADVTALVNDSGEIKASYYYDAFGNITDSTGNVNNSVRYSGYEYDEENKLYYLNARYYDPSIARFMSEDTYRGSDEDALSLNLYTYVSNEPIMYSDPTGHLQKSDKNIKNLEVKAELISLTTAYFNAKTSAQRTAISQTATNLRESQAAKQKVITPLMYETKANMNKVIDIVVSQKGNMTAAQWNSALKASSISSTKVNEQTTRTTIGRTFIEVSTKGTADVKVKADIGYTITNNEKKFLDQVLTEKLATNATQGLAIYDFMKKNSQYNNFDISKKSMNALNVNYEKGQSDWAKGALETIFWFAEKGTAVEDLPFIGLDSSSVFNGLGLKLGVIGTRQVIREMSVGERNAAGKAAGSKTTGTKTAGTKTTTGGCNCFTAGTKVLTDNGEKNIEDIEVGDMVLSKDEVTGEVAYKEVTATFNHKTDEIFKIHVGGQTIESTFNHPFWVYGKGWTFVKDLKPGDLLVQSDGNTLKIDSIELLHKHVTVYNMTVDEFHTYFVSDLGIWVHNTNCKITDLPTNAQDIYKKYEKNGWQGNVSGQTEGTAAGSKYNNKDGKLPVTDSAGNPINYKEYDVNNKLPNEARDAQRFVRGTDGSIYYTNDHYANFTKVVK
ncbi:RHS repeat-associated protein [Paenibacillus shirakamiensis]|uniref:RHS repeat-associated protein n=1 Tax=Paenibacillus shirakamiensis TaxID=1265935 RepID=A0ABS4JIG6_9BACL|nr:S8 family serine peptidase [Paenibacillus shirakamiensis]MBP2000771.1 RHS repeat-associated protein [Paenibacillus shirakamiensis]